MQGHLQRPAFGIKGENMERGKNLPNRLYKYRDWNARTLDMVVSDKLHFADPATFNDPLDTRPSLKDDVDNGELRRILRILIEERSEAKMRSGPDPMKLEDLKTEEYIKRHSRTEADQRISEIEYGAMNADCDSGIALRSQLNYCIELELIQRYERGIVSFPAFRDRHGRAYDRSG